MRLQELARILELEGLTPAAATPRETAAAVGPAAAGPAVDEGGWGGTEVGDSALPSDGARPDDTARPGDGTAAGGTAEADPEITRAYVSDLMSDVLVNAPAGGILVTLQVHLNVIAVAGHAGLRAVVFSGGRVPDEEVIEKAAEEGLSLYRSSADTFTIAGRLYELGLRGNTE